MNNIKPWETPRVSRIVELFGGKITAVKQLTVRRSTDGEKNLQR